MGYSRDKEAFTFVEVMVTIIILSLIFSLVYFLYSSAMRTYTIASWKQDHLRNLQYLLKNLKEDLSEASPKVEVIAGETKITDSPLQFSSTGAGPLLLKFLKQHLDDASTLDYVVECKLELNDKILKYSRIRHSSSPNDPPGFAVQPAIITVDDVASIKMDIKFVVFSKSAGCEYVLDGPANPEDEEFCGTLLNLSFFLKPPANVQIKAPLVETFKIRLNVRSEPF